MGESPAADEQAVRACIDQRIWPEATRPAELVATRLTGATNQVFSVGLRRRPSAMVIVRVFGRGTDRIIDRALEAEVMAAAAMAGVGPGVLASFDGGRVEQFLPEFEPFKCTADLFSGAEPRALDLLADVVGRLHATPCPAPPGPVPALESGLRRMLDAAEERLEAGRFPSERNRRLAEAFGVERLRGEAEWLCELLPGLGSPLVLCHGDLSGGNVLGRWEADELVELKLVDFEYSGLNYAAFELANLFCDAMTVDPDAEGFPTFVIDQRCYPDEARRRRFVRRYLAAQPGSSGDETRLLSSLVYFTLAAHLYWALWALTVEHDGDGWKGYLEYGMSRLWQYDALKHEKVAVEVVGPTEGGIARR